jgi:flagellar biosynthesis/type III secretory pathway M-ring protein FliF/YscJ
MSVGKVAWGEGDVTKLDRLWDMPTLAAPWPQGGAPLVDGVSWATYLFQAWVWIALGFMVAFLVSFFFTSQTVIYFLLRKNVDATDMEEVYVEESEEEPLPLEPKAEGSQPVKVEEAEQGKSE